MTQMQDIVRHCLLKKVLVSPEYSSEFVIEKIDELARHGCLVLTDDAFRIPSDMKPNVHWREFERSRAHYEKGLNADTYRKFVDHIFYATPAEGAIGASRIEKAVNAVEVTFSYDAPSKKRVVQDFIQHLNVRFRSLEKILRRRRELQSIISINRILSMREKENVAFIGMISDIKLTKNGNILLTMEDPTGSIKVLISNRKPEMYQECLSLVEDECIGILGTSSDKIVFANTVLWPDVPMTKELKKSPDLAYSVFMGDTEFGCNLFLYDEFERFLQWINGEVGSEEQKKIANNVKYLFIVGDLVNGVGIYPNQEKSLDITDIYEQYERAAQMLRRIPRRIRIIICPGNHDAMRIAEPQPVFYKDIAKPLWDIENATLVSNPARVTIHKSEHFPGFDVLLYHGFSFVYYADRVEALRMAGGISRSDLVMKFLLQRRHLAPTHGSNLYIPEVGYDPLAIETVPDFFISGHVHTYSVSTYRGVTCLNCSCWVKKTPYQEKFGIEPQPGRILVTNLQTRETKVMKF